MLLKKKTLIRYGKKSSTRPSKSGVPKHLSVHVGGIVITPDAIASYVPIETAPKGVPIITWDKDGAELGGLVKIDFLGNRSLAVIRDTISNLGDEGVTIDPYRWRPIQDRTTMELLARGDSMGVFLC